MLIFFQIECEKRDRSCLDAGKVNCGRHGEQQEQLPLESSRAFPLSLKFFLAKAFANLGWDGMEHSAMDASLHRPTEIALSRGNLGKANEK